MNFRKHLAGFAIFSLIVGCAVLINQLVNALQGRVFPAQPYQDEIVDAELKSEAPLPTSFKVGMVSLDFGKKQSYTVLTLNNLSGQSRPSKLWVTTVFFTSDRDPHSTWTTTAEVTEPFAEADSVRSVVTASCKWCDQPLNLRTGYFARVYVSSAGPVPVPAEDSRLDRDITQAVPVVVHWPEAMSPGPTQPILTKTSGR